MPQNGFTVMPGFMPSFQNPPPGCRFAERCPLRLPSCSAARPAEQRIGPGLAGAVEAVRAEPIHGEPTVGTVRTVRCPVAAAGLMRSRDGATTC
jgi:hypothetical protein